MKKENWMDKIGEDLHKWVQSKNGNVCFVTSLIEFNEEGEVINDRIFAFGYKDVIEISLDGIKEEIEKEKEDFISW